MKKLRLLFVLLLIIKGCFIFDNEGWYRQENVWVERPIFDIFFIDENNGWAVGSGLPLSMWGFIIYTTDGGNYWDYWDYFDSAGYYSSLLYIVHTPQCITFVNPGKGFIVGDFGLVGTTEDSGKHWQFGSVDSSVILRDVFFFNETTGWAVGDSETVIKTQDGGNTWVRKRKGNEFFLMKTKFASLQKGWAVGGKYGSGTGVVLTTSNGGENWEVYATLDRWLFALDILDEREILVAGNEKIYFSPDGGHNWIERYCEKSLFIWDMVLPDKVKGWAVGNSSTILHTEDNGKTWSRYENIDVDTSSVFSLKALTFPTPEKGWVGGYISGFYNFILHYRR